MYTLEITESAERDLEDITDYIAYTLCNPPAVDALLDSVDAVNSDLQETPEMFPLCNDTRLAELGYHKARVRAYIMVYEIDEEESIVRVLRFFHESENYSNKL